MSRSSTFQHDIPTKANRILNIVLGALILILLRVWHLSVIQYDQRLEESRKPQKKTVIEPAIRATIRDRFNLPLAINKLVYQATILYAPIRDMPASAWKKDATGKKSKYFKRKEYIQQLSKLLAKELQLDPERVEDLIHAKASYYAQVPFVIKDEITEQEYYRLKILEKDWPGIYVRRLPKRYYPRGRVAADIIGYMGAINRQEYEKILQEIKTLERLIAEVEEGKEPDAWPVDIENSFQARKRLKDLEEKAYTIHDQVGKTGVEDIFEEQLRGFYGKKIYYTDSKGHFLRELPGSRPPLAGQRLLLTISAELQEYAEQLLAQNEALRLVRLSRLGAIKKTIIALKEPWIKGGAIVVMDPQTAEILTLASYPRFNPNDFIASGNPKISQEKKAQINRWLENEFYLADIWNQQRPLERERYDRHQFYDEKRYVTWETFLDFIFSKESALKNIFKDLTTIQQAVVIQQEIDILQVLYQSTNLYAIFNHLYSDGEHLSFPVSSQIDKHLLEANIQPHLEQTIQIKKHLGPYFEHLFQNYDKVLLVDLCRLAVDHQRFSPVLIEAIGGQSLTTYKQSLAGLVKMMSVLKEMCRPLYHDHDFKQWRKDEGKAFLDKKRAEEKRLKIYPKPYLDYFDQQENLLFKEFWERHRWNLLFIFLRGHQVTSTNLLAQNSMQPYLDHFEQWYQKMQDDKEMVDWKEFYLQLQQTIQPLSNELALQYLQSMRPYQELNRPLFGRYRYLRQKKAPLEKHLASAFYPLYGFSYGRSHAYRQATIQGSIFKLITAYAALVQKFRRLNRENLTIREINPLVMVDQYYKQGHTAYVGYTQEGNPIPQLYKGGRLPRSLAHQNIGEIDLIRALEVSSNPYFSLLAGDFLEKPEDLVEAARLLSYGERTGIHLPGEIKGHIPDDITTNRTGLYALAIGQHSLVVTPLQTAVMLAAIANQGKILKPKIVNLMAGRNPRRKDFISSHSSFPYKDSLATIGIDFPLFTAVALSEQESLVKKIATEVKQEIFMPQIIRSILLKGLQSVTRRTHQESKANLLKLYRNHPEAMQPFTELKDELLGKTSTSESVENIDLDFYEGTNLYTHVWFGSIAFQKERQEKAVFIFKDEFGEPEIVVVVYLRYGGYGKEAAPLAAQMVKKWREIKQKYQESF